MNIVYLILGGNLGKRDEVIFHALRKIDRQLGKIIRQSGIYESEAWGYKLQPSFFNCVVCCETLQNAEQCLKTAMSIEEQIGRIRTNEKWRERIIDIDILYYNQEVIDTADLKVPHPQIQNRRFALIPLVEIAQDFMHPTLEKSNYQLLENCEDTLDVKLVIEAKLFNDLITS